MNRIVKRRVVFDKTRGRCFYCGTLLDIEYDFHIPPDRCFTIDHFIAVKNGGASTIDNLVPSCMSCNSSKGNLTIEEWRDAKVRELYDIPRFSARQKEWLEYCGFTEPKLPNFQFWFEKDGNNA